VVHGFMAELASLPPKKASSASTIPYNLASSPPQASRKR
jgi:hypothetical protein